jgi:hypothetical protein
MTSLETVVRTIKYTPLLFLSPTTFYNGEGGAEEQIVNRDDCPLLDALPALDVPEYITCKDWGSQQKVFIIWDLNHDNLYMQQSISDAAEELYQKAGISFFVREGRLGYIEDVLSGDNSEEWVLPALQQQGARFIELVGPVEEYVTTLDVSLDYFILAQRGINEAARKCYEEKKDDTCYDPKNYDTELLDFSYKIMKREGEKIIPLPDRNDLKDVRHLGQFAWWYGDFVRFYPAVPFRSYASVDTLLDFMTHNNEDTAVLIFGEGHMLQIEGYLDQQRISHAGIFVEHYAEEMSFAFSGSSIDFNSPQITTRKQDYKEVIAALQSDEERHFSQDVLDFYRYNAARNNFDMARYKTEDVKEW